jgi:hypothetical protein
MLGPNRFQIGFKVVDAIVDGNVATGEQSLELQLASLREPRGLFERQLVALKQSKRKLNSDFRFEKLAGTAYRHNAGS